MPGDLCMKTKLDVMRMVSYKENCRQAEEDRDRVQELNNNLTQQNLMQQQTIQRLEQRIEELTEERELNRQTIRASNAAIMHLVNPHNQQEVQQPQQLQQQQPLNRQQEVNPQANYYQNHYQQMHYQPQRQLQMHNNPQPNIPQQPPNYQHLQPNIQQQPPNYQHLQPNIQQQPANYQQQYPPNNQIQFNFQPNINNVQINFMLFDEQQPVFCFADKSFRDSLDHLTYGGMLKRIKAKKTKTSEGLFKPFTPETTPKTTFDSTKVIELTKIVNASEPSELPQLFSFKPQDFADVEGFFLI
ncbi:hypothetical protein Mgra_00009143 [Meloidogyne graminicola]|uniref:Uncharacterized protein n=1 Tax=Meloidogyne graminicola TaxID=189291 RepID=A0A8S9ZDS9_9BILA|nr:hypothetical protein Mgra_00009143 [Meloidogyne graminicola]